MLNSTTAPSGALSAKVIRGTKSAPLSWRIKNMARPAYLHGWLTVTVAKRLARLFSMATVTAELRGRVIHADGTITDYGVLGRKVVTNAGVAFIVDAFQNIVELENMHFHGIGTGNTAENVADTALVTELTTEYVSDNTRATGTTIEGASANIYRTVATNTVDAVAAIVEHGIFDQASNAGGVLLDRSVFAAVNLASADSLQTTYDLTFTAGS